MGVASLQSEVVNVIIELFPQNYQVTAIGWHGQYGIYVYAGHEWPAADTSCYIQCFHARGILSGPNCNNINLTEFEACTVAQLCANEYSIWNSASILMCNVHGYVYDSRWLQLKQMQLNQIYYFNALLINIARNLKNTHNHTYHTHSYLYLYDMCTVTYTLTLPTYNANCMCTWIYK